MFLYLPIAELSVNVFVILGLGIGVGTLSIPVTGVWLTLPPSLGG